MTCHERGFACFRQDEDKAEAAVEDDDPLSWRLRTTSAPNPTADPDPDPLSEASLPSEYSDNAENTDVFVAAPNGHIAGGRNGERPRLESAPAVLLEALGALPPYRCSPLIPNNEAFRFARCIVI